MQGIFGLNNHHDLFRKLESEYDALVRDPNDPYSAYNFFSTAWHLLEWKYPGRGEPNSSTRKAIRAVRRC